MLESLKNYQMSIIDGLIQGGTYYEYGNFSQGKGDGKKFEREKKT